ncbi:WD40 repeat domain-containing protein [Naegleria gruberi]|uniref:WD40 repeat domain-containing protein n=1 Tax=Naegleria gruberi TaxID=5762 RepID=D2W1S9_NAEGR|nr:WD40 repeat domain-containing protein [Naegleria gruberi]EFC37018.1 WD40 repeat domain-containing protein [Naegleria gruberi]|eukprot:XP_002669762.1 WD40 repeat domain-containing protein [Naegleria gruberi strain NEG-M]
MYHPFLELIVTGCVDHSMKVFDPFGKYLAENSCLQTMFSHVKPVTSLAFHFDLIISGSSDMLVKIWKPDRERKKLNLIPWFSCFKTLTDCDAWISALWASPEDLSGEQGEIVVGTMKGTCYVYKTIGELRDRKSIVDVKLMYKLKMRDKGITNILMLQGSNMMVSTGFDNVVKFTDYSGKTVFSKFTRDERICGMDWDDEHEELITVTESGKVDIYQYRTGETSLSFYFGKEPTCLSFFTKKIIVSGRNGVQTFSIERNIPHKEHKYHTDAIVGIGLNTKRTATARLITAGSDNKIVIWEVSKFDMKPLDNIKYTPKGDKTEITSFIYVDDGIGCTGHDSGHITLWNLERGREYVDIKLHQNSVYNIIKANVSLDRSKPTIFSPRRLTNNKFFGGEKKECLVLVTASFDGSFAVCDLSRFLFEKQNPVFKVKQNAHNREILCLVFNPMDKTVITGGNDGMIRFWAIEDDIPLVGEIKAKRKNNEESGHKSAVVSMVLDGNFLFTASEDQTIGLWNVNTREKLASLESDTGAVLGMCYAGNGRLMSWFKEGRVEVWRFNAEKGSQDILFRFEDKKAEFSTVSFDEEKDEIFAGDIDGKILRVKTNYNELNSEAEQYIEQNFRKEPEPVVKQQKKTNQSKLSLSHSILDMNTLSLPSTITMSEMMNQKSIETPNPTSRYKVNFNLFDILNEGETSQ